MAGEASAREVLQGQKRGALQPSAITACSARFPGGAAAGEALAEVVEKAARADRSEGADSTRQSQPAGQACSGSCQPTFPGLTFVVATAAVADRPLGAAESARRNRPAAQACLPFPGSPSDVEAAAEAVGPPEAHSAREIQPPASQACSESWHLPFLSAPFVLHGPMSYGTPCHRQRKTPREESGSSVSLLLPQRPGREIVFSNPRRYYCEDEGTPSNSSAAIASGYSASWPCRPEVPGSDFRLRGRTLSHGRLERRQESLT